MELMPRFSHPVIIPLPKFVINMKAKFITIHKLFDQLDTDFSCSYCLQHTFLEIPNWKETLILKKTFTTFPVVKILPIYAKL